MHVASDHGGMAWEWGYTRPHPSWGNGSRPRPCPFSLVPRPSPSFPSLAVERWEAGRWPGNEAIALSWGETVGEPSHGFLELVHTLATVSLIAMFKTFHTKLTQKKGTNRYSNVVREVLRNNYWSCNLIGPYHFGNNPKKSDYVHKTVSCWEAHTG